MEHAIFRALSKDRDQRQQTARELFDEFARAAEKTQDPSSLNRLSTRAMPKSNDQVEPSVTEYAITYDGPSTAIGANNIQPGVGRRLAIVLVFFLMASIVIGMGMKTGFFDPLLKLISK